MRSIKSGRLRLQVFSIDNKWRAARLAELSLRTSHLVLRTFVGTTNINLSSCMIIFGLIRRSLQTRYVAAASLHKVVIFVRYSRPLVLVHVSTGKSETSATLSFAYTSTGGQVPPSSEAAHILRSTVCTHGAQL